MNELALLIQCFIKQDTLEGLCQSLLRCTGHSQLHLIFWSDSPLGSRSEPRYSVLNDAVEGYLDGFVRDHAKAFKSVSRFRNETNLGTCRTCEVAMNRAFENYDYVVFTEDDVIFSKDALEWFGEMRWQGQLSQPSNWAIAGESIFFNAQDRNLTDELIERARTVARDEHLDHYYISHKFIPSTCFATTRERWAEFGATRGQPLGDVDLCKRCETEGHVGVFPVVPRVRDVGMLHDEGYSVSIHSKAGVTEIKNTYLTSDDVGLASTTRLSMFERYEGDAGRLFRLTSLLDDAL